MNWVCSIMLTWHSLAEVHMRRDLETMNLGQAGPDPTVSPIILRVGGSSVVHDVLVNNVQSVL